jgi:hypothetical protein
VNTPVGEIFVTALVPSVNQTLPSPAVAIRSGLAPGLGSGNWVMTPPGVIRAMLLGCVSVNQRLPSPPLVICPAGVPA